jgi:hypothetical protein
MFMCVVNLKAVNKLDLTWKQSFLIWCGLMNIVAVDGSELLGGQMGPADVADPEGKDEKHEDSSDGTNYPQEHWSGQVGQEQELLEPGGQGGALRLEGWDGGGIIGIVGLGRGGSQKGAVFVSGFVRGLVLGRGV